MPTLRGLLQISGTGQTAKGNTYWKVKVDGEPMNVFAAEFFPILQQLANQEVMCEYEESGKYKNFVSLKIAEGGVAPATPLKGDNQVPIETQKAQATQGYKQAITPIDPTRDSIEAQKCLGEAVNYADGRNMDDEQVAIVATRFLAWLRNVKSLSFGELSQMADNMKEPVATEVDTPKRVAVDRPQAPPLPDFSKSKSLVGKSQVLNDYRVACGISPEQEKEILCGTVGEWLTNGNTHEGAAEMFHKWAASR